MFPHCGRLRAERGSLRGDLFLGIHGGRPPGAGGGNQIPGPPGAYPACRSELHRSLLPGKRRYLCHGGKAREAGERGLRLPIRGSQHHLQNPGRIQGDLFQQILSLGNQCDLSVHEVLRYYAEDPRIRVICAYVEQAKGGREFSQALREVARKKPLIIMKGGATEIGARAAFSHTGALASYSQVWQKAIHQLGVILVDDLEEMADATFSCLTLELPRSPRVGIVVVGGGSSVEMTDVCARNSLEVPILEKATQEKIGQNIPKRIQAAKTRWTLGSWASSPKSTANRSASPPRTPTLTFFFFTRYRVLPAIHSPPGLAGQYIRRNGQDARGTGETHGDRHPTPGAR